MAITFTLGLLAPSAQAWINDPTLGFCARIMQNVKVKLGFAQPLSPEFKALEKYALSKEDIKEIQKIVPENITDLTGKLVTPIQNFADQNPGIVYRGMRISLLTLSRILKDGIDPKSAEYGSIYTAIEAEEAARYTIPLMPDTPGQMMMAVFAIDPQGLDGSWPPIGYFITEKIIPAKNIRAIWLYDRQEPDLEQRFIQLNLESLAH